MGQLSLVNLVHAKEYDFSVCGSFFLFGCRENFVLGGLEIFFKYFFFTFAAGEATTV